MVVKVINFYVNFSRGKILFTPVTNATVSLMARVNETFNDLLRLRGFEGLDDYFNDMEQGFFVRVGIALVGLPLIRIGKRGVRALRGFWIGAAEDPGG